MLAHEHVLREMYGNLDRAQRHISFRPFIEVELAKPYLLPSSAQGLALARK